MRRISLAALALFVLVSSCAATLRVSGTAPTQVNDGACSSPVLLPGSGSIVVHAQVVGRALEDSITTVVGAPFAFAWTVPAGVYQVRSWASPVGIPALAGCDTTITANAAAPPWRVRIQ